MSRDKDWIVSSSGWWNLTLETTWLEVPTNNTVLAPLSAPVSSLWSDAGLTDTGVSTFESSDDWTIETIRGQIMVRHDLEEVGAPWHGSHEFRIEMFDMDPNTGVPGPPSGYDLQDARTANRAFLWHRSVPVQRLGSWLEPSQAGLSQYTIDVDVKSRRRVHNSMGPCLVIQNEPTSGNTPRMHVLTRLRTLGSKSTG